MILGAALLVLVALALFVGGIVTGATALYWGCIALSLVAAVLLYRAWWQTRGRPPASVTQETESPGGEAPSPGEGGVPGQEAQPPSDATSVTDGPAARRAGDPRVDDDEAPVEEVEVTDLLLVMELHDEVVVVDEHPRYHLADCPWLQGRTAIPLPVDEARTDGFTPCGVCAPDRHLAAAERDRRTRKGTS